MSLFRRPGWFLVSLALAAMSALPATAEPRLAAPHAGAELAAGSVAMVAWEEPPPRGAEEWEAFLSLDGGKTYRLRITPHLDIGIRRFAFQVPPFPTRDARLLLRFGDERHEEREVETDARFAILTSPAAFLPPDLGIALSRGEKPRPRDSGVVVWVEGERDGSGLRQMAAEQEGSSLHSVVPARLRWIPLVGPQRAGSDIVACVLPPAFQTPVPMRLEPAPPSPPVRTSVRMLTGRRNE
jgi:hypothetical protein